MKIPANYFVEILNIFVLFYEKLMEKQLQRNQEIKDITEKNGLRETEGCLYIIKSQQNKENTDAWWLF